MKKFLLICVALICSANFASASTPDSCLKLVIASYPYSNYHALKVDSCLDSPTYLKKFSKGPFLVILNYDIFEFDSSTPPGASQNFSWNDILPNFIEERNNFSSFESKFGNYYFYAFKPILDQPNPDSYTRIRIMLDNYADADEVMLELSNYAVARAAIFEGDLSVVISVSDDITVKNENMTITDNILNLKKFNLPLDKTITIYDINGSKVLESNHKEIIDISNLTDGVYFVKVGNKVQKFLVVR